tara:strand:- start:1280 stop:1846 length:567 start_codon:yes stop_codon:yes gene_type:complete
MLDKKIMKTITLTLLPFILILSSLNAEEEKSYLKTKDEISTKIRKYYAEMSKENIKFAETFFSEDVEVSINDLKVSGKKNYIERLNTIHKKLFKDMKVEELHVHTNYFSPEALTSDGKTAADISPDEPLIWTNAWGTITGVGRITNKKISFRMHMDFRTSKGKVIHMLAYYDPTQMNEEIKALEASEK